MVVGVHLLLYRSPNWLRCCVFQNKKKLADGKKRKAKTQQKLKFIIKIVEMSVV